MTQPEHHAIASKIIFDWLKESIFGSLKNGAALELAIAREIEAAEQRGQSQIGKSALLCKLCWHPKSQHYTHSAICDGWAENHHGQRKN